MAFLVIFILLYSIWDILSPNEFDKFTTDESPSANLIQRIVINVLFAGFIALLEFFTKGRTLGKLITGTKAVKTDGTPISPSLAFQRGLARIVPFEPFSALNVVCNPWHDRWTKTMVIDIKKSSVL
jgi:uncharacterized RDD family membrane protein YckC